jgi:hypothetical protein
MKKCILKSFAFISIFAMSTSLFAQLDNLGQIMNGGVADANKLAKAYMNPFGKGFGTILSNGWYNTATPHGLLGFDITINTTFLAIPTADKSFDVNKLGLTTLTPSDQTKQSPTFFGSNTNGQGLELKGPGNTILTKFTMPQGVNFPYVPIGMIQGGIGLIMGTEIDARYLPTISLGNNFGSVGLWGVGIKHDLKQWIPVVSMLPFFSISAQAGYTSFKTSANINFPPDPNIYGPLTPAEIAQFKGQSLGFTANSFTGNLIVSTDIPIFNVYGSLGFSSSSSNLKLTGNYPVPGVPSTKPSLGKASNPVNVNFTGYDGLRASIGARLKLLLFTINADITYAGSATLYTAGIGLSFR